PENVPFNHRQPPVLIDEVLIEGDKASTIFTAPTAVESGTGESGSRGSQLPVLRVPAGKPRFEIHYTALSLTAPEKIRFKYKLENLDNEWVEAGAERTAHYSYVRPGSYNFRVLACNNDGVWNEQGASLAVIILPHFWQTWWFRVLVVSALLLLF